MVSPANTASAAGIAVSAVVPSGCDLGPGGEHVEERADAESSLGGVPEQAVPEPYAKYESIRRRLIIEATIRL
jgi:hypothetical protein